MNKAENLNPVENPFTFAGIDKLSTSVSTENMFRLEKTVTHTNAIHALMEQPVNNYLKSQEEMEAEFCYVINSRKAAYPESEVLDPYGKRLKNTDGLIDIHDPDALLSGYMEENY